MTILTIFHCNSVALSTRGCAATPAICHRSLPSAPAGMVPSASPSPWHPTFYFLPPWTWLPCVPRAGGSTYSSSFCDWLMSLSITSSGFIHTVARVRIVPLFKIGSHSIVCARVCTCHTLSAPLWLDVSRFCLVAVVIGAAMNDMGVQTFLWVLALDPWGTYTQKWDCRILRMTWQFCVEFSEAPPYCFP